MAVQKSKKSRSSSKKKRHYKKENFQLILDKSLNEFHYRYYTTKNGYYKGIKIF